MSTMSGLARIVKLYGGMTVSGKKYVWDYVADKAVLESEMPFGSDRHKASEKAKYLLATTRPAMLPGETVNAKDRPVSKPD